MKNKFPERLRELRQSKNLLQKHIAEVVELPQQTISRWESGQGDPGNENLIKLAIFFGCSVDYLVGYTDF